MSEPAGVEPVITTPITEPGIYQLPTDVYLADPVPGGSLSSSGVRPLLRAPALYRYERENHRPDTAAFDLGSAVHTKVLGTGKGIAVIPDEHLSATGGTNTGAARTFIAQARAGGLVPVKSDTAALVDRIAEAVLAHPGARRLLEQPGTRETTAVARERGVFIRAMVDHLPDPGNGRSILVDLKTAASAYPPDFTRSAASYGYDVQADLYQRAVKGARGDHDTAFVFVVVEKDPPHLVSVVELVGEYRDTGRRLVDAAIDRFAECQRTGVWTGGYGDDIAYVDPPKYHLYAVEELTA